MGNQAPTLVQAKGGLDPSTLHALFERLPHGVAVLDPTGRIVATNPAWHGELVDPLLDCDAGESVVTTLAGIQGPHRSLAEHLLEGLTRVLDGRSERFEVQYEIRSVAGPSWFLTAAAATAEGGVVLTYTDTTTHNVVHEVLADMAFHDTLTRLPNRALVVDRIRTALVRAQRTEAFPAIMFIDLDGFKAVNDLHGHVVGDAVLVAASERLTAAIREGDTCGRWGGDEFVLVIDLTDPSTVERLVERAQRAFDSPIVVDGMEIEIGLSIGVVVSHARDTVNDLIRRADVAMYQAKRSHRGVQIFDSSTPMPDDDPLVVHLP